MKSIKFGLYSVLIGISLVWLLANLPFSDNLTFIAVRNYLVQYSGVLGIATMSIAMILATRPNWSESLFGGLDKTYRLHKWLGISGLIFAIAHWIGANGPKWLSQLGLIERGRPSHPDPESLSAIEQFLGSQRESAEFIGEWAFYLIVVMIGLALIKRFPYKLFAKTHKWIAVVYLFLVFHTIILMDISYWSQTIGVITGLFLAAGSVSAAIVLTGRVGRKRRASGIIESLHYFEEMNILETTISLDSRWRGHNGGQFAFVTFDDAEGPHPYTIASNWDPNDRRIMFITKALGDYTHVMPERLKVGDSVSVEGPYGKFMFNDGKSRQIWIGGGIGITPFIARMKQLAGTVHNQSIDLIHTTPHLQSAAKEKLIADTEAAHVNLQLMIGKQDGRLDGERLRSSFPDWKSASIWFCGPKDFGEALRKDLMAHGMAADSFHQELFNMR